MQTLSSWQKNVKEAVQIAVEEGKYTRSEHAYPRAPLLNHVTRIWSTKLREFCIQIQLNSTCKACLTWADVQSKTAMDKLRKNHDKFFKNFWICLILFTG